MPEQIISNRVILVEGIDAKYFFIHTLKHLGHTNFAQVFDYGGITQLTKYLQSFQKLDGYEKITSILIARDAEASSTAALKSINSSLKSISLIKNDLVPFKWNNEIPKVGCVLFPGYDASGNILNSGTLEDLCIKLVQGKDTLVSVDSYLSDFESKHFSFSRKHKNKLHAAISFTNEYVGMKLGEATNAKFFDLKNQNFSPYKSMIESM